MAGINDYAPIVGQEKIEDLKLVASRLEGKRIKNINSTAVGGGVAEILNRMVPLLRELGVDASWDVIKGGEQFYGVTKKFHNALHGKTEEVTVEEFETFIDNGEKNMETMDLSADVVFVHDPQPVTLVKKRSGNKWLWRCHVDVSDPDPKVWAFLREWVDRYDAAIFSAPGFSQRLGVPQYLISPSIDPLSDKNKELEPSVVEKVLYKYNVPHDKPIVTQISRFDRLKDPIGVIQAYFMVKKYIDCRLVLAGGGAADDPEGARVLEEVMEYAAKDPDVHVLLLPQDDIAVNALQRASTVVMQKSIKEGFGLTISEALWKGKPVIAGNVGGIPLQVKHKYSGLLCSSVEGAAFALKQLLNSPEYARKLGENGREHVRHNFLLTRHLKDYLLVFLSLFHPGEDIVCL
ncbi:MAG: glycosyltransferase [Candidatus Omnitrophica bacterium]|nr:glycosyltransferase [Candidatus Omnitrophota bacterium]